ncbi:Hypothetical protein NTJ_01830 [Nesidiocoris tenuis]|uniref:Uncharacterized protein n=1 Tax=Nesidiocoris tenuis TaxID=355587 RepID=A0ABN7A9N1_9HEMI|nr:Hypothetical protein NTJ_01830 [Nesidiocoris tenuis]
MSQDCRLLCNNCQPSRHNSSLSLREMEIRKAKDGKVEVRNGNGFAFVGFRDHDADGDNLPPGREAVAQA